VHVLCVFSILCGAFNYFLFHVVFCHILYRQCQNHVSMFSASLFLFVVGVTEKWYLIYCYLLFSFISCLIDSWLCHSLNLCIHILKILICFLSFFWALILEIAEFVLCWVVLAFVFGTDEIVNIFWQIIASCAYEWIVKFEGLLCHANQYTTK
jgi:hypothetical protein